MSKKKYRTDILFPRPNMITGAGTVFNLAGKYFEFNVSASGEEADNIALSNDWGIIADHFKAVIAEKPITEKVFCD